MQLFKYLQASLLWVCACACVRVCTCACVIVLELQRFMPLDPSMGQGQPCHRMWGGCGTWVFSFFHRPLERGQTAMHACLGATCRWLHLSSNLNWTWWWEPSCCHWDLLCNRYSFINNKATTPKDLSHLWTPQPWLMNLFWILLPPDRNYIPSFCYNKERKWCESTSCRLPSEFISTLQTRSPGPPPACAPPA